ncbi:histidine kinase [uncultured Dokdonia sp.]|uniref:tetratricopeptide repeat-containing sensor histidine kinase n=1 Tax=uncultured Dokdonia sp. TaxID=575653 RepID=UPI002634724B|nr:histidine kinase [uncultured Dokdonia sp.]
MPTRYLIFFFIVFVHTTVVSQQKKLDSVLEIINPLPTSEEKLKALFDATTFYRDQYPEINKYFAEYGIAESKRKKSNTYKTFFNKELGIYYRRKNNLDSALYYYNRAKNIAIVAKDSFNIYGLKGSIANVHKAQGNYKEAIQNFSEIISYAQKNSDNKQLLIAHVNLAALYITMKESSKAKSILLKGLNIKSEVSNIANPKIYNNLVVVYLDLKKTDSALFYAIKAEKLITSKRSLANLNTNKGIIYKRQKKYSFASESYRTALDYYKELNSNTGIIKSYNNLAQIAIIQNNLAEAKEYLDKSYYLIKNSKDISYKNYFYESQIEYFIAKKEYKKALETTQILNILKDSILGIEKQNAISDIEIKYETEKTKQEKITAQNQAAIAQLESSKNRNLFIGSSIIAALVLISSLFFFGRIKAQKKAELITVKLKETQKRLALEKQYRNSELKALKAQMNPHFIFNALNSIQEYIILNEKNLASDYLGKFADLIRKYLDHSDAGFITVQEEIESLQMYLDLETLRFEDTLTYKINIGKNIQTDIVKLPTMLIQPYVENALKHGLLHKDGERILHISFTQSKKEIISCAIQDNGIGRKASAIMKEQQGVMHQSFATQANENRLQLLNYKENKKIGVEIIDLYDQLGNAQGTKVTLDIPLLKS